MIADTIVVVMVCIMPSQQKQNRFDALFEEADRQEYKLNLEELKKASAEAAKEAFEKTKKELDKLSTKNQNYGNNLRNHIGVDFRHLHHGCNLQDRRYPLFNF